MNNLITIPFHNQSITAIQHNGKPYVAMRPIVENLGLAWQVQHRKINEKFSSCVTMMVTHDSLGRKQEMLCLPISKIAGFLYTINASKVKPQLRETILLYQDKCDEVLDAYFRNEQSHAINFYQNRYTKMSNTLFSNHPLWDAAATYRRTGHTYKSIGQIIRRHPSTVSRMVKQMTDYGIDCQPINALAT